MPSEIILLERKNARFEAGYTVLKQPLAGLIEDISLLHFKEKEYFDTLQYDRRRQSYLLGRIASKKALSNIIGAQKPDSVFVDSGIFQFPVVKYVHNLNVQVSISHCEDIGIALAFPEAHPMGIDIEKTDPKKIAAIESQMTAKEKTIASETELSAEACYTMLWTIKEGLSKILKTGLMTDFQLFEISSLSPNGNAYESIFTNYGQYKAISYLVGNYSCSVVLPRNTKADMDGFRVSLSQIAETQ